MRTLLVPLVAALALAACAPGAAPSGPQASGPGRAAAPKTITAAITEDPKNMWDAINGGGGSGARNLGHLLNQYLAVLDSNGDPHPRLLAELPSVDKGTWTLFPDGKMETTWKLRPGVVWHDGTTFTADDVLFSFEVGRDRDIPNGNQATIRLIEGMEARDASTVVVRWRQLYAYADRLEHREFYPVAKHILGPVYESNKEGFLTQPYWNDEWIGLGPYRVGRWERDAQLELRAFDGYFLGRPKIDTVIVKFIPDLSTILANLHARAINTFWPPTSLDWEQMDLLKQQWESTGHGTVLVESVRWKFIEPQKKPQQAQPADLTNPRVREALLLGINRAELAAATWGDDGTIADSWVHPRFPRYQLVQDAIIKYAPHDPNRAAALLAEAGWTRGADGVLEKGGQKFNLNVRDDTGERTALIVMDSWKVLGINSTFEATTPQQNRNAQFRASFTGVDIPRNPMGALSALRRFEGIQVPTSENRFAGTNRGGYANPAWDDAGSRLRNTLEEAKQIEIEKEMLRILTTELPVLPLYYELETIPVGGGLVGPRAATGIAHTGNLMYTWNVHEWEMR